MSTADATATPAAAAASPDREAPDGTGRTRPVTATCLGCIAGEMDRLEAAHAAGTLRAHGGWTPGQVLWHVGRFMRYALEGFPFRAPLPIRMVGRLMKRAMLSDRPLPRGISLKRPGLDRLLPPDDVSFEQGAAEVREILARVDAGERFTHPSPLVGPLTHEQWVTVHAKHFAHHVAMLSYPGAGD